MSYISKQDHQLEDCRRVYVVFLRPATGYVCRLEEAVFTFPSAKIQREASCKGAGGDCYFFYLCVVVLTVETLESSIYQSSLE